MSIKMRIVSTFALKSYGVIISLVHTKNIDTILTLAISTNPIHMWVRENLFCDRLNQALKSHPTIWPIKGAIFSSYELKQI